MKFNINVTTEDGELLVIIPIDSEELNWDTHITKNMIADDIYNEINKAIERG